MFPEEIGAQLLLEDIERVLRQRINSDQDELLALQQQADEIREFLQLLRQPQELEDISGTSTGTEDGEVIMVRLKNAPSLLTTLTPTHDQPTDVEEELEYVETDAVPTWSHIAGDQLNYEVHEVIQAPLQIQQVIVEEVRSDYHCIQTPDLTCFIAISREHQVVPMSIIGQKVLSTPRVHTPPSSQMMQH